MPEIKLNNILDANKFLQGKIERTPLLTFDSLSEFIGFDVYFKAELFQKTGSFKIRGILNKLRSLNAVQKKTGVVAMSAGDHAVSLAIITSRLRIPCVVILPTGAVKSKMSIIKKTGARIVIRKNNLWDACIKMQEKYGLTVIHPFDDPLVIAGQGTIGLEILSDLPNVDMIFIPVGGGGLISGISLAVKSINPKVKIIGVEPENAPTLYLSIHHNNLIKLRNCKTIADGLAARYVGKNTLSISKKYVDNVVLVSDEEIIKSMKMILKYGKILTEPSAAAAFAAVLFKKVLIKPGSKIACLISGVNQNEDEILKMLNYYKKNDRKK